MNNSLVSVIVPSYNHENYVSSALESIVRQCYRPIEIVVVDDGSKDRTLENAREFLSRNSPNALVISQPNMGAARAINNGILRSRGKYINVLNSDDSFEPDRIEACVRVAEQYGLEFIYTGVNYINALGEFYEEGDYVSSLRRVEKEALLKHPTLGFAFLKNQLAISTGNMFMSRQLVDRVGPFNSYLYVHDWDYVLRCIFYAEPYLLPQKMYNYRLHDNNSFRTLSYIEGYETSEIMANALWRFIERVPLNSRCPSPHCWPGIFEKMIDRWGYKLYLPPRFREEAARRR